MPRILVLDDSVDVLKMTQEMLGGSHEVVTATSWSAAFSDLVSSHFDLILLDVELPGLQGNDIASILAGTFSSSPDACNPKIILFSAMDKSSLKKLARASEVDGFIHKDFSNMTLLKRKIEKHLVMSDSSQ